MPVAPRRAFPFVAGDAAVASEVAASIARSVFECVPKGNTDDWRNLRLGVSPVPGGNLSAMRVRPIANDALV